jgi:hypothetical protein
MSIKSLSRKTTKDVKISGYGCFDDNGVCCVFYDRKCPKWATKNCFYNRVIFAAQSDPLIVEDHRAGGRN